MWILRLKELTQQFRMSGAGACKAYEHIASLACFAQFKLGH